MTESGIRKVLANQGYKLHKGKDSYGADGYYITDIDNVIVTNRVNPYNMSLDDIRIWIKNILEKGSKWTNF